MKLLQCVDSAMRSAANFFMNIIWPKARILIIILIAVSMAEFVAIDAGMILAADILLYVEVILGAWAFTAISRFAPSLSMFLMLLPVKISGLSTVQGARSEVVCGEDPDPLNSVESKNGGNL